LRILISRTDAIGDVVLTLPMVGQIRKAQPESEIFFLCRDYTAPVVNACGFVNHTVSWDQLRSLAWPQKIRFLKELKLDVVLHVFPRPELAFLFWQARVPRRIGVRQRLYHWLTCNTRVNLSRRESDRHEADLNQALAVGAGLAKLHQGLGRSSEPPSYDYGLRVTPFWPEKIARAKEVPCWILHPGSHGSARSWPIEHFVELARRLLKQGLRVAVTGTEKEGASFRRYFSDLNIHDLTGQLTLTELMGFISVAQGIVAGSTGPLHIAAALGRTAIGVYPARRPMHAGRWGPRGPKAVALTSSHPAATLNCARCVSAPNQCLCMAEVTAERVVQAIDSNQ
jgi:heptosyltransferase III